MRVSLIGVALALCCSTYTAAQLDEVIQKAVETLEHRDTSALSDDKIIAGLKQALQVSTGNAVSLTGKTDSFLKNEASKILLPPKLETVGKGLRMLGMGAKVDEFEVGMNRAAEQATPQAKQIFLAALKKMAFDEPATFSLAMTPPLRNTSGEPVPPISPPLFADREQLHGSCGRRAVV